MSSSKTQKARVLVIGLDGATFDLLLPWLEEGFLPHLAEIWRRSSYAPLRTTIPPITASAWTSFQTGKNPAEFGVFGFVELQQDYSLLIPNHTDIKCRTIWQRLSKGGRKFAALGIPISLDKIEQRLEE